ncbi:MAG: alpha/beta hydrolase [Chloroflexi bacterium]|nr:alpha/beta hydrolase [Chloroflexota bacterium]
MTSDGDLNIHIEDVDPWEAPEGQAGQGLLLCTNRGDIQAVLHHDQDVVTSKAIVWVYGASGGFRGPGDGLYTELAEEMKSEVTSLRLNYRIPNNIPECVLDSLAGISFLKATNHTEIALVGHSFGGAVVITAGSLSAEVKGVVAMSSQTYGASNAGALSPRPLLLVHGAEDTRLPPSCSEQIYQWANEPKELRIMEGAEHRLSECKEELREMLKDWILEKLE